MSKSPWVPLLTALVLLALCTTMTLALPETLPIQESHGSIHTRHAAGTSELDEELIPGRNCEKDDRWRALIHQTREYFAFATCDASVVALVSVFLVSKVGRQSLNLLLQYVSKRYDWSLSKASVEQRCLPRFGPLTTFTIQAGLLLSLRAGVNILLFTIVLPFVVTFATFKTSADPETSATSKDLWIARASIILMIIGTLILSVSATPALMVIGKPAQRDMYSQSQLTNHSQASFSIPSGLGFRWYSAV